MNPNDPIKIAEEVVRLMDHEANKYARPVFKRYPLVFSFLTIFSAAAILHGFELWADRITLFREKPLVLIALGVLGLLITGTLYKFLRKNR